METGQPRWGQIVGKCFCIPQRIVLSIMGFFAIVNAYTMRVCLSVAITEMVKPLNISAVNNTKELYCPDLDPQDLHKKVNKGDYDWSEMEQASILAGFYIGYFITHIPGGYLAQRYGGKWVLNLGILSTAIFTVLTPITVDLWGGNGLIVLRVLMGLGEGVTFPALSSLMAFWIPARERGTLGSLILGGSQIGTVLSNAISGFLLHSYKWPIVYYFWSVIAVIWCLLFAFLCYNDPESHPFIKDKEKEYLMAELGRIKMDKNMPAPPFCDIIKNVPVLALICAQLGHDAGYYIMVSDLPKYMANVLRFTILKNGISTAMPYLLMWVVSLSSGFVTDLLIRNNYVTITGSRKFNTLFAGVVPAIFMVGASYAGCNRLIVVILFTLSMGAMGLYYAGLKLNPNDLSPNYAGTIMGIVNGSGAITGIITPYLVGGVAANSTILEWRIVFWVAFTILVSTSIIYFIWASAEVQPFDDPVALKAKKEQG